ncbi:UxaA family hydrolase [Youngiibacter fragilis]|uniref:D-galactarate dehydratase n=1 Tax=Youngiibacter fragilis 232.1 TaxID=994573 RepID=V7I7U7_9CLOT|nr:UxaA family hydrolase [Youngiibacter fragilis]ETA81346.1 D-galactarate dehydratase [Youngiibacter fragilis 232.1]
MVNSVIMNEIDTVVTVTSKVSAGNDVGYIVNGKNNSIKAASDIPKNHKVAVRNVIKGNEVYKYGEVIGYATEDINIGDHVHENNLSSFRQEVKE